MRVFPTPLIPALALIVPLLAVAARQPAAAQSAQHPLDTNVFIDVSRKVLPSVVNITIEPKEGKGMKPGDQSYDDIYQYFLDQRDAGEDAGTPPWLEGSVSGSGVLVRKKEGLGYILTNSHVVRPLTARTEIKLTFHQREEGSTDYNRTTVISGEDVRVAGTDELSDLAVIEFKMPAELDIEPIEFADSERVEIGENVIALGNPLGLNHSITQGIISGKARDLGTNISIEKLFQTSVVIQPGNSGGPLVNLDGNIVGINNAIASANGYWQGTSFAIPGNEAKRVAYQIVEMGRPIRGYLGVTMENVTMQGRRFVEGYKLDGPSGVFIKVVVRNSPADLAGIRFGDVITEIDGKRIGTVEDMLRTIAFKPVDSEVQLSVVRLNEKSEPVRLTMSAKVTERPRDEIVRGMHQDSDENGVIPRVQEESDTPRELFLGMDLETFYDVESRTGGLRVLDLAEDSKPFAGGMKSGDVILELNGRRVLTLPDFLGAMAQPVEGKHSLRFQRDGQSQTIEFKAE